jgi:hypothetical protein
MGWIRDSLRHSTPHRSLGAVARAALAHANWPDEGRKPQERSLAALLSKLDRGLELEWLADRPAVQQVLADVLGIRRSLIGEVVGAALEQSSAERHRIRLQDLPYASVIDLTSEPLPPGIPDAILEPRRWDKLWWRAPTGSGRSLVGAWLAARGLATFVTLRDSASALPDLPPGRPVFVELTRPGPYRLPRSEAGICVAAAFSPDSADADFSIVLSPKPVTWIVPLVKWLALRLPRDGHFVPSRAEGFLQSAAERGVVDRLGTALGLAGLIDLYGIAELERRPLEAIAESYIRDRLQSAGKEGDFDTAWILEHGAALLSGIATRLLTDSPEPWDAARTFDEWVRLVPPEHRETVDAEWVRLSLSERTSPPTVKEVERALREVSPGAFRIVRTLERAGLLRGPHGGDTFALAPRWLGRSLVERARHRIVERSPVEWGRALLEPHAASAVMNALVSRATGGDEGVFDEVLEHEDRGEPAIAASLEASFVAAGIAVLSGVEVPLDTALALWEAVVPHVVERGDGPYPCVLHTGLSNAKGVFLGRGAFVLAAFALSELLPENRGARHTVLRPWLASASLGKGTLDAIWNTVKMAGFDAAPWTVEALTLLGRLSPTDAETPPHAAEWPGRVLDAIERDSLSWTMAQTGVTEDGILALFALAARRRISDEAIALGAWTAWMDVTEPIEARSLLWPSSPKAHLFYANAPAAALGLLFQQQLAPLKAIPFDALGARGFRAVLAWAPASLAGIRAAWQALPKELVREAALKATNAEDVAILWEREPEAVADAFRDALWRGDASALPLLRSAPVTFAEGMLEQLEAVLEKSTSASFKLAAKLWLHDAVRERRPGYQAAFRLLREL